LAAESAPQSGPEQLIAPSPPPAPSQNPEAEPEAAAAESETDEASRQVKSLRQMTWSAPSSVTPADLAPYEMPERGRHKILVAIRHAVVLNDGFQIQGERSISSDSFDFRINEWDEAAMEEALLLSEKIGQCEVVAVTIGSEDAEKSLRKAMAMGADRGVRIWDERLAEADPITIARGLAGVAKHEQPDLFLCGVQSSDLGNGSTGIALAGILGVPHSAAVVACDWEGGDSISLTRELEGGTLQKFSMPTPAVLTIQTGANQPRYATMRMIKQARKKPLVLLDGSELDDGSSGHVVQRIYVPETEQATMLEYDAAQLADFIVDKINETNGG
jgi:electron transfer flavoprotein alpha/beta subunit